MKYLDDPLNRAIYATDASNYRIPPNRIAQPANVTELRDVILEALGSGTPLTMRGRGTSCAGNSIGPGLVVDTSKGCNRIVELDPAARTITVEPGVVLASIQEAVAPHGLRFGPDPSTWTRATIGGSIGNNACGPHAQAWGRVADNVLEMQVVDGFGREFTAGAGNGALDLVPGLARLVEENLALIRTECGRFSRQVSGYSLEHLLPENGRNLAKFLVGSEGTLVSVLQAKLRLVEVPAAPVLVVLGYPDMIAAAADVPLVNSFKPLACEGMDSRLVYTLRQKPGAGEIPELPEGKAWLLVEMGGAGESLEVSLARARDLAAAVNTRATGVYPPGTEATRLWRIRADGAGLGGRTPLAPDGSGNDPAWPGWEDAAVPPEDLAAYLQDFTALMREMDVDGMLYGHLGDGCLHVRLNLPLGAGASDGRSREFLERAADLVGKHHGSLSGEHGDGRARSELLPRMYSPELIKLFGEVKALFDPRGLMNPGVLVDPAPLDENLRLASARTIPEEPGRGFAFPRDTDLTAAFHRCTGVGKCLAMDHLPGAWMCPSYEATGAEKDATRGRARALQEVTNGGLIAGFDDPALLEALDLCLACKACTSACPTGIDMAAFRSEAFYRAYRGRPWARPGSHFLLGKLPFWLWLARHVPGGARLANAVFGVSWMRRLVFKTFGLAPERQMAHFAGESFRNWIRVKMSRGDVLFDSFSAERMSQKAR
ncbi:MAG: FAD-binding protein, partial [Mobiluncus sp.]|uniref:FAD-binding and (Fe-S)-binding domain-containing protein n=2 Tax=Mobiluncus TaxID=2050 RepID=UPI002586C4A9